MAGTPCSPHGQSKLRKVCHSNVIFNNTLSLSYSQPIEDLIITIAKQGEPDTPAQKLIYAQGILDIAAKKLGIDTAKIRQPQLSDSSTKAKVAVQNALLQEVKDLTNPTNTLSKESSKAKLPNISKEGLAATKNPTSMLKYISLTPDDDVTYITERAEGFHKVLRELGITVKKNNKTSIVQLTEDEIHALHEFFFIEVFGYKARNRLYRLQTRLDHKASISEDPCHAGQVALQLSHDQSLSTDLRELFSRFHIWHRGTLSKEATYTKLLHMYDGYKLYNQFTRLASKDQGISAIQRITSTGLVTSRGKGHKSLLLQYVATSLGLKVSALKNKLQQVQSVHLLVKTFGCGILVLLPPNAPYT